MRNIAIVISNRAHYSSIKSVLIEIKRSEKLNLQLITTGAAVLDRYGNVAEQIVSDGFDIQASVNALIEGETLTTMAKSVGLGVIELSSIFENIQPDIVLTVGDRYETMSTVISASYMNIVLAHTMGGEVSGTIDESIRHAITKFAHIHFPASKEAAARIEKLGEDPSSIHLVGCPRIDLVHDIVSKHKDSKKLSTEIFEEGVGPVFDLNEPFLLLSQHPVTTEYGLGEKHINETLTAIEELGVPTIALWPNSDAGSEDISRGMRKLRERNLNIKIHFYKNLPVNTYIRLMMKTSCLVGNSSSGIREGPYIGTPTVNIGTRQNNRERGRNVIDVNYNKDKIKEAIIKQMDNGRYASDDIYGHGRAAEKIVKILESSSPSIQKTITY